MKKFNKLSKNYLNKPWIESDFALEILNKKKASEQMKKDAKFIIEIISIKYAKSLRYLIHHMYFYRRY